MFSHSNCLFDFDFLLRFEYFSFFKSYFTICCVLARAQVVCTQCEQILAKFCHFGQILKVLGHFCGFIQYKAKFCSCFGKNVMQWGIWGIFAYLQMAKYFKIIQPSGHTVCMVKMALVLGLKEIGQPRRRDSNPRPLECDSPPITTRPELPPLNAHFFNCRTRPTIFIP